MEGDGVPVLSSFQQKGEGGREEDETWDGCWSQKKRLCAWGGGRE